MKHANCDDWSWCEPCGKRRYWYRKSARKIVRRMTGRRTSTYRCPHADGWHVGHLPRVVARGEITRGERYGHEHAA